MRADVRLMILVWTVFLSLFGFAALGDSSLPHIAFHVVALVLLVPATLLARRLRRTTSGGARRLLAGVLSVTLPLAVVGHALELATAVVRLAEDGWVNRDTRDVFESGAHAAVANLTIPAVMLSMLASVALVVAVSLRERRPAPAG